MTLHTDSTSVAWNSSTLTLSGNVTVVNHYGAQITGLTAMIDSISATGVTTNSPWSYGTVAAGGTSSLLAWQFSDPSGANFTFTGHVTGNLPAVATQIASHMGDQTCVVSGGGARCWGVGDNGQLGNGATTNSNVPVAVSGLASGVAALSAGAYHACALTTAGGVQCWGNNFYGALGNGATNTSSDVPVAVSGLASGVAAIAAGFYDTCAVTTAGGAECWGFNGYGQLGNGSTTTSAVPVAVSGLASGVAGLAAGLTHTCAVTTAGGAKCWGFNGYGALGNGSTTNSNVPVAVSGLGSGVAAVAAGLFHSCAITTAGGAKCWGYNQYGQLGNGATTDSNVPVDVSGLGSGVAAIAAAASQTCALTTAGAVMCWGDNSVGELGNGSTTSSAVPVAVSGLGSGVAAVAAGGSHTCALTTLGEVKCWGANSEGELGNGSTTQSEVPVETWGF